MVKYMGGMMLDNLKFGKKSFCLVFVVVLSDTILENSHQMSKIKFNNEK
jgi:hypothetical protein